MVSRELALMKVAADATHAQRGHPARRDLRGADHRRHPESLTIQVTGETEELLNFEQLLRPFGLIELVKTGVVALGRGASIT